MFRKVALILSILCLPSCFETKKKKRITPSCGVTAPKTVIKPLTCKNDLCIWPIKKMHTVQTFIDTHLKQGYKPSDILVIFDVDETLLTSFAEKDYVKKKIMAHDLFPYLANSMLIKHIPTSVAQKIVPEDIDINKKEELARYIDPALIDAITRKTYAILADLHKRKLLSAKAIEPHIGQFITQLHQRGIPTIGLTARGIDMKEVTLNQLKKAGIDLTGYTLYDKDLNLINKYHGFSKGFIFSTPGAEGFDKGTILLRFFKEIAYQPHIIIFIDDNLHFLESVQEALAKSYPDMTFDGLWYHAKLKHEFDKELADQLVYRLLGKEWWHVDNYYQPARNTEEQEHRNI